MENEKVAVDEAVETVAEQNARAYSKTVWTETTPITADKLNKMENGIAAALPLTGGTLTGSITLPNSTKGQIKQTLTNGTITPTLYITSGDNLRVGSADIENLCLYGKTNPKVSVNGSTYTLYHTGNKPKAADIGAMGTSSPTFEGNLYQNGPGGKDWIYHINAERGTLNIAPRENGNPNWGKQIFIDRNGQLHCNGNRRVATINQENPAHHIIRYGAGMGGENGYITFSW